MAQCHTALELNLAKQLLLGVGRERGPPRDSFAML